MTQLFDSGLNPQKLKDYQEKDLEFKSHARNILVEKLGYEPPLSLSILSEISLRGAYRRFEQGQSTSAELDTCIAFHIGFINRLILDEAPSYNC